MNWEVLPHPPHSSDIVPSHYHLFQAIQNDLLSKHFKSFEDIEKWIEWIVQKARISTGVEFICCVNYGQRLKLLNDNTLNKI